MMLAILAGTALAFATDAATLLAPATTAQLQQAAIALNSAPTVLKADVAAAGPTLRPFLITLMCAG